MKILSCVFAVVVLGAAPPADDDFKVEEGFTLLFNGKDLSGWTYKNEPLDGKTETPDKRFSVADGIIVAHPKDSEGKGGIRDLWTAKMFEKSFRLKLEFRAGLKADSGVYLRKRQLQVRDYLRRGEQKQLTKFKNDGWNELDLTVRNKGRAGGTAECLCNGEKLDVRMRVPRTGPIGLQAESGKFEFRRIRVKILD